MIIQNDDNLAAFEAYLCTKDLALGLNQENNSRRIEVSAIALMERTGLSISDCYAVIQVISDGRVPHVKMEF